MAGDAVTTLTLAALKARMDASLRLGGLFARFTVPSTPVASRARRRVVFAFMEVWEPNDEEKDAAYQKRLEEKFRGEVCVTDDDDTFTGDILKAR